MLDREGFLLKAIACRDMETDVSDMSVTDRERLRRAVNAADALQI